MHNRQEGTSMIGIAELEDMRLDLEEAEAQNPIAVVSSTSEVADGTSTLTYGFGKPPFAGLAGSYWFCIPWLRPNLISPRYRPQP
jgi:hypothetical protein